MPIKSEAPATVKKDAASLSAKFPIVSQKEFRGELTLTVNRAQFHDIAAFLRDQLGYTYLIDVSSVDYFGQEPRYEVVCELQNFERADHLRVKYTVSEDDATAPTVTDLWATADWHEREVFDMMGIRFTGHPDLRRILMWEGYPFHPLRKDFPLAGKDSDTPDVAFSRAAPLTGGPFVTSPTGGDTQDREPRSREME
jgi:NADH-quinone oxidoreductase subunit C